MTAGDLTRDAFLGGRLTLLQPRQGYRAATDPIFLAAACGATAGQTVLELGCGVGTAALALAARVPGLDLVGVERQAAYAALARQNAADADLPLNVVEADLAALPPGLRQRSFDHVIANPPYYAAGAGTAAGDAGREAALREETPLALWVEIARARLKPKGWLTMIQAADRLPDLLGAMQTGFGSIAVRPIQPRPGRAANRILLRARKGGRGPFVLCPPFLVHDGEAHPECDRPDYTALANRVLREAAPLPWG